MFQPASLVGNYDKAHNTYLELAFDLGIPAACTLVLAVIWVIWRCFIGFGTRGRDHVEEEPEQEGDRTEPACPGHRRAEGGSPRNAPDGRGH